MLLFFIFVLNNLYFQNVLYNTAEDKTIRDVVINRY